MSPTDPVAPSGRNERPHPARTARMVAAVVSVGTFGAVAGALAANATADSPKSAAPATSTTTVPAAGPVLDDQGNPTGQQQVLPGDGYGGDDGYGYGYDRGDDHDQGADGFGAAPGGAGSGFAPQQAPNTQSHGS